ncbi:hypothetical protein LPJ53_001117 [Coemansia erecta]|uniref:Tyrosinase copper-binding domain-containing protein n=1 Tax=Coemansia erecta TaxID=147472 RepID=A0A9W8CUF5_9FUNG|nr:hypothetical protein LPJ53_001117 [Coemansia erecta]
MMSKSAILLAALCLSSLVNAQCANPKPRPEIRSLSPDERARFFRALEQIRTNGELDRLSKLHVDNADSIHGHPVFLAFHRLFVNDFAAAINKVDPGLPVPYWDWSLDATNPISSDLFTSDYLGGNGAGPQNCVQNGPFANWQMDIDSPHCLARKFNQGNSIAPFWPPEALLSMQKTCNQYGALSSGIENGCHGAVHLGISGDMSTMFAPNDPFFFLHHGMVDKLWYDWQLMDSNTRFQMYDNVNYNDPSVSANDPIPGYPNMHVGDVLDPRNGLCYVYVDSGSGAATKRLMQEVDRQSAQRNAMSAANPNGQSSTSAAPPASADPRSQLAAPQTMASTMPSPQQQQQIADARNIDPASAAIAAAASASGNGNPTAESTAQLNDMTSQISRLSGNRDARAGASAALHNQQVNFLQNTILNGLSGNRGVDMASAILGRHHRFLRRYVNALTRRDDAEVKGMGLDDILTGLTTGLLGNQGLLGKDGLVGHLLQGLGHVVEVLPQGLSETLKAVGSIADNVTNDVFNILKLPKVDMSKVPENERRIPYVAKLPDWWYQRNNLNATYANQLHDQMHTMIDGFNSIPGYVSPAVAYYAAKKYGASK